MDSNTVEKGSEMTEVAESAIITVNQPQKLEGLLETISLINTVSERMGEDRSGDLGSGGSSGGQQGDDDAQQTWRDKAIANLPSSPVMQKYLEKRIRREVKKLQDDIRIAARRAGKPGSAYKLNELYSRIRRLNGMLRELYNASVEVIKRLYVRIFIDKQPVF